MNAIYMQKHMMNKLEKGEVKFLRWLDGVYWVNFSSCNTDGNCQPATHREICFGEMNELE